MSASVDLGLDALADAQVLDELRQLEATRRALEVREAALIEQARLRNLAFAHGCKNLVDFLRSLLNIGARDAAGRAGLSAAVCPQRSLCGEVLPARHPLTAEMFTAGVISARAAWTVVRTVDRLPSCVLEDAHPTVERVLLDFAAEHDPETLTRHANAVSAALDQDGAYRDLERAHRDREFTMRRHDDGTASVSGKLTTEAAEYLATMFDALAKPAPAADGSRDPRTPGQRRHDALLTALKLLFASGSLPSAGGCATTVVLTMGADALATGTGVAKTAHGYAVPVEVAKGWLDPEARAILVLLSKTKGIEAYSSTRRLFTEQQRLAMFARDGGCSYPGCDTPLAWTDAHHVTDYKITRRTSVDDGALVCGAHHDSFERMGWKSIMHDGRPYWVPPSFVDQRQKPRRNRMHD